MEKPSEQSCSVYHSSGQPAFPRTGSFSLEAIPPHPPARRSHPLHSVQDESKSKQPQQIPWSSHQGTSEPSFLYHYLSEKCQSEGHCFTGWVRKAGARKGLRLNSMGPGMEQSSVALSTCICDDLIVWAKDFGSSVSIKQKPPVGCCRQQPCPSPSGSSVRPGNCHFSLPPTQISTYRDRWGHSAQTPASPEVQPTCTCPCHFWESSPTAARRGGMSAGGFWFWFLGCVPFVLYPGPCKISTWGYLPGWLFVRVSLLFSSNGLHRSISFHFLCPLWTPVSASPDLSPSSHPFCPLSSQSPFESFCTKQVRSSL